MEEPDGLRRATELWQEAYRDQMDGELDRALERYQRSRGFGEGQEFRRLSAASGHGTTDDRP
jgi:hypothetical protein